MITFFLYDFGISEWFYGVLIKSSSKKKRNENVLRIFAISDVQKACTVSLRTSVANITP